MFGISSSKEKEELALVFDIGSSSVGGALFYVKNNKKNVNTSNPKIIFSIRQAVAIQEELDIDKFLVSIISALESIADAISRKGLGAPAKVFCVLSSPWHVSQTRVITLEKEAPFVFTSELANTLTQKEISLFEEEHIKQYAGNKIRPIELKNMQTALNGYITPYPIAQKASSVSMTLFVSMSPEEILVKIEEAIKRHFNHPAIKFSSFAMASFAVVRDLFLDQPNFLLIDIGGELTDITMTKKDVLLGSISFPLGTNFFVRKLASEQKCTIAEAESMFAMYNNKHIDAASDKKMEPTIKALQMEWLKKFQESLVNLSNDISIPATMYLSINKEWADFFSEIIKNEQFNQYTLTESKFQINFLGTETLHGAADFEGGAQRDPATIIESMYINRYLF